MNFYQQFIKNYSKVIALMMGLLWKDVLFEWKKDSSNAFEKLKMAFIEVPILVHFDLMQWLWIKLDALAFAIGAVIF